MVVAPPQGRKKGNEDKLPNANKNSIKSRLRIHTIIGIHGVMAHDFLLSDWFMTLLICMLSFAFYHIMRLKLIASLLHIAHLCVAKPRQILDWMKLEFVCSSFSLRIGWSALVYNHTNVVLFMICGRQVLVGSWYSACAMLTEGNTWWHIANVGSLGAWSLLMIEILNFMNVCLPAFSKHLQELAC